MALRWVEKLKPGQVLELESLVLSWFNPASIVLCAIFVAGLPEFGPNRFTLAAALAFVAAPIAVGLRFRFRGLQYGWVEPLYDVLVIVGAVNFIPDLWFPALCIGLMVSLAPSIGLHQRSYQLYALLLLILLGGMGLTAVIHAVPNWQAPLLGIALVYPSLVFYSHLQTRRADALRDRAYRLKSLTQVAGSVAHDFNNMLMGISGHAELALCNLPPDSPARGSAEAVIDGSHRASLLCRQLLVFANHQDRVEQQIDLSTEVDNLIRLLGPKLAHAAKIGWTEAPEPMAVRGDVGALQQVIMNVLINAVEAADEKPASVALTLRRQRADSGDCAVLEIADAGRGIPKRQLKRIFEPLYTTKTHGQGLGLASARRIMRAHEGNIAVASEAGQGTTVTLTLPIDDTVVSTADLVVKEAETRSAA
ncbi:MAG: ATP-binding protein [Pseudomonadota bacterium]